MLLSSVGSSTAVYLYLPQKSWIQSQFLAWILSVSNKHSFSVGMKSNKHAGNKGRCSSACFTQCVELYISSTAFSISFCLLSCSSSEESFSQEQSDLWGLSVPHYLHELQKVENSLALEKWRVLLVRHFPFTSVLDFRSVLGNQSMSHGYSWAILFPCVWVCFTTLFLMFEWDRERKNAPHLTQERCHHLGCVLL